jgi:hypothetical protein
MPLYGIDKNGHFYEESSIDDKGRGKRKEVSYSDEGSVVFGSMSAKEVETRKKIQKSEAIKKQKIKNRIKAKAIQEKRKKVKEYSLKRKIAKKNYKKMLAERKKRQALVLKAAKQPMLGYEYSDLLGSPFEGFQDEGEYVMGHKAYMGSDCRYVENFGSAMSMEGHDEGLGFKISFKKPKITIAPIKVTPPKNIAAAIKDIGKATGNVLRETNPLTITKNVMTSIPVLKDVYRETDKFTGGTLTKLTKVSNLPSRALQGKPISKADLIEAAMVGAQIGAIVASGGSAASIIGATSGALKNGPLGQSTLGRNILAVAEIAGNAAAIHQAASSQLATQAGKQATTEAGKKLAEKTAFDAATQAVKDKAKGIIKSKAEEEFEKKTGIPTTIASKVYNLTSGKGITAVTPKDVLKVVAEDRLKKAGLGDSVTQAILSNNAAALGVTIKNAPNLLMDEAKRKATAEKIRLAESLKLENIKKKIDSKLTDTLNRAKDIDALHDKIAKEANNTLKAQMEKQLASMLSDNMKDQEKAASLAEEYQLEAAKGSINVAAAEEGRYVSEFELYSHPIAILNRSILSRS